MLISQPILVLFLALAFGLIGGVVIAVSTSTKTLRNRVFYLSANAVAIVLVGRETTALDLRFNFTPSMPMGIYQLAPASPGRAFKRGMFVAVCPPLPAARIGRRRGYLAVGVCPADTEPLLKVLVAVAYDDVSISPKGVAVNGCLLPRSRAPDHDAVGRRLRPWPNGHYKLRRGQLWVYADNDRSWDSRFWGPVLTTAVVSAALQVLTVVPVLRSAGGELACGMVGRLAPRLRRQENGARADCAHHTPLKPRRSQVGLRKRASEVHNLPTALLQSHSVRRVHMIGLQC